MNSCGQACPYNTLNGCKVKEYNEICPLTNMATPITEYRMTNADRIRAMSDEELAEFIRDAAHCLNMHDPVPAERHLYQSADILSAPVINQPMCIFIITYLF